jgi:signal transduction histidine kinase
MELRWIENHLPAPAETPDALPLVDRIVSAADLADQTLASVQRIAAELRPGVLDSLGLIEALRHEASRFAQQHQVRVSARLPDHSPQLSRDAATAVFRIAQEALTNVARHAAATDVEIDLQHTPASLTLQVLDNGSGIPAAALADVRSLGLLGMRERAELLGGELHVGPRKPSGTCVQLHLPLDPRTLA